MKGKIIRKNIFKENSVNYVKYFFEEMYGGQYRKSVRGHWDQRS